MSAEERIDELEATIAQLREQIAQQGVSICDLRAQQKVSGCFRSEWGAEAYATIRGYLATLRKQGQALLAALTTVFVGQLFDHASVWPGIPPGHCQ